MTDSDAPGGGQDPASFRDPSGYVFRRQGRVFRAIDARCRETLGRLMAGDSGAEFVQRRFTVASRFVEEPGLLGELAEEHPGYEYFLEHDRITPITYPYEWTVSMLADAAVHTIDFQTWLLHRGASLKDATAFNIQFVENRPVFIDLSSIEEPARLDIWIALGQFSQMFTFPLLLFRHDGWDLRSYFLGHIGGRTIEQVARSIGPLARWRPRYLLDITVPLLFHRKADAPSRRGRELLEKKKSDPRPQLMNLRRLRSKIRRLAEGYSPESHWSRYTSTCAYDDASEAMKKRFIREYLEEARPRTVLDLGCNTGQYSTIAADCGAHVIAADADHDAVEILYRRLRANPRPIVPMVLDVMSPSPAVGFLNRERPGLLDRIDVDCILCLALVHHLRVSGNLPLPWMREMFARMTRDHLILEFVPREDRQFQRLTRFRADLYEDFTLDRCREVFGASFDVVREEAIPRSSRTLLFLRKRPSPGQGRAP